MAQPARCCNSGGRESRASGIPYRLFALSNLASLLALGIYPTLIEPRFTLQAQRVAWSCGFACFALLAAVLALRTRSSIQAAPQAPDGADASLPPAPLAHKILWLLLPMGASMQLSAVTAYITANIAPIPLLWILPLAVYLLTIVAAFEFPRLLPRGIVARFLVVMLAGLGYMLSQIDVSLPMRIGIASFLVELFVAGLFCHGEACALRPPRPA